VAGGAQGWYFFPILLLLGLSMHDEAIRGLISPAKTQRRWVEIGFLTLRLGGLALLVFLVLSPEEAVAFLGVQLAVFGLYMGSSFAPNHIDMPLVSSKLKLDFLRRQVLMSRNISGGSLISVFMGGLNYQIEHHLFPSMARPDLRKAQPLVSAYCAAQGVHYTRTTLWHSYRSEQAAMKCLYLVTGSLDPKGTGQTRWATRWKPALNAFAITFAEVLGIRVIPVERGGAPAPSDPREG
jgi:fatty acid desaturase